MRSVGDDHELVRVFGDLRQSLVSCAMWACGGLLHALWHPCCYKMHSFGAWHGTPVYTVVLLIDIGHALGSDLTCDQS